MSNSQTPPPTFLTGFSPDGVYMPNLSSFISNPPKNLNQDPSQVIVDVLSQIHQMYNQYRGFDHSVSTPDKPSRELKALYVWLQGSYFSGVGNANPGTSNYNHFINLYLPSA